ncbi:iron ABC transporter permease [uncultured Cohaesibacter sp.]|uniref:FecCD family ABC transporter permease n=1 Tax=uncultured Cohaesibacter sp. TaxID=1002546 RepID=UPI00292D6092|nr:iron ABC transporter permease [uncultured Cohaesibacter sp.]
MWLLLCLPLLSLAVSLCIGRFAISIQEVMAIFIPTGTDVEAVAKSVVLGIRLPRGIAALLVGAGLAVSGAAFQGLFRNPLVGPSILGVAQGAGFGAALGLLIADSYFVANILAFLFGIIAVSMACFIGLKKSNSSLLMLVLAGIVIGAVFTALISLVKYTADPEEKLPTIVYWLMGGLSSAGYRDLLFAGPIICIGSAVLVALRWRLNVLALGEEAARSFGEDTRLLRFAIIGAATIVTSACVAVAGIVGWVGLLVPHIGRMFLGPDHSVLLPASLGIGACYLLIIDVIARTATTAEIPLSILTALVGAPFFAWLLARTGGKWS